MKLADVQKLTDVELLSKVCDVVMNYKQRETKTCALGKTYINTEYDYKTSFAPLSSWTHTQSVIREMRDNGWCYTNTTNQKTKKLFISFTLPSEHIEIKIEGTFETEQRNILECALLAASSI